MVKNNNQRQINITLKLPKKLEQQLTFLETISKRSKDFIIKEALIQYIEDMEDIQKYSVLETLGELEEIKKQKTYTTEELNKELGL
jgi:predicted DNA-binding protein